MSFSSLHTHADLAVASHLAGVTGRGALQVRDYVAHVIFGRSIRAIARASGRARETVRTNVRRVEQARDERPELDRHLTGLELT